MLACARASGLGAWGLDLWSGHCGLSLVSRGRRHVRVGAAALGNLVFRVTCICMGVGPRFTHVVMSLCVRGLGRLVLVRPAGLPGPVGFVLWAPGSSVWSCLQVLYLVLRVLVRGPNSVHSSIRCTSTPQGCDPVALVLERMRVVAGEKKRASDAQEPGFM